MYLKCERVPNEEYANTQKMKKINKTYGSSEIITIVNENDGLGIHNIQLHEVAELRGDGASELIRVETPKRAKIE